MKPDLFQKNKDVMCQELHGAGCSTLVILRLQISWSLVTSYIGPQSQYLRSKFQSFPDEGCYVYMTVNCRNEVGEIKDVEKVQLWEHICSLSQE